MGRSGFEPLAGHCNVFRIGDRDHRRAFTIDERKILLSHADPEWQSLIKFGLYTGHRLADIATLKWEQIDLERDEIRFFVRKTKKQKSVPIASALREHLLALPAPDMPYSPVHSEAYRIVTSQHERVGTLSNAFADLLPRAGLRPERSSQTTGRGRSNTRAPHELSFHSIRHTSVSLLKDAGIPDAVVMAIVGHSSAADEPALYPRRQGVALTRNSCAADTLDSATESDKPEGASEQSGSNGIHAEISV